MSSRPVFDPSRIPPSLAQPGGGDRPLYTPRRVNELVRGALNAHLPATLHVVGELGDLSRPGSGHLYFCLKDRDSELRCVMWRSSAATLKFRPEAGMELIATGTIETYLPRGTYQLIVRRLEPRGVGALELAFRQLCERLQREGLFDEQRKRPLPRVPRRVAIITSPRGAAIRDILHTLERRFPRLDVLIFPVAVQGAAARDEIVAAIQRMNALRESLGGIDVAIVGRGGGSLEDLWAFNEEIVARAIAASAIPIVSAVGHETDVTIADFVADLRAPTPTAAAELITPVLSELIACLQKCEQRAGRAAGQELRLARAHFGRILAAESLARPFARVRGAAQHIDELVHALRHGWAAKLRVARHSLGSAESRLACAGPLVAFLRARRRIERARERIADTMNGVARQAQRRIDLAMHRIERAGPPRRTEAVRQRIEFLRRRAALAVASNLRSRRAQLQARFETLAACDPRHVLKRGYSITRDARSGRVIRSVQQVHKRLRVITQVADGEFRSTADDPQQPRLFE